MRKYHDMWKQKNVIQYSIELIHDYQIQFHSIDLHLKYEVKFDDVVK